MIAPHIAQFALDTLGWTALLIAVVLLARRPVARLCGPQVAYALWLLPMARLFLPPLTLPAWLAPAQGPAMHGGAAAIDPSALPAASALLSQPSAAPETTGAMGSAGLAWIEAALATSLLVETAFAIWLTGAAVFLYRRFAAYFALRGTLLAAAREVGRAGRIRLVETPGTNAPLAFGVIDPVIALPPGFMAQPDRRTRDLALAHELAHHRAHDLLVNIAVQPLFALHWWNPLGNYGWLALRRDQEAACDARVLAKEPAETRAAYAHLIASTATAPRAALAAPMACPVLGDKSIIQRLRSLNMTHTSGTRRLAGGLMVGAALIALPLTATITYAAHAETDTPMAQAAGGDPETRIEIEVETEVDTGVDTGVDTEIDTGAGADADDENTMVIRKVIKGEDGVERVEVRKHKFVHRGGEKMTDEEKRAHMEKMRAELGEVDAELDAIPDVLEKARLEFELADGTHGRTVVKSECRGGPEDVAKVEAGKKGERTVYLCQARVMAKALDGLKQARKAIADNPEIKGEMRAEMLRELDSQIANWNKDRPGA